MNHVNPASHSIVSYELYLKMKYALICLLLIVSCAYSYTPWANWKIRMLNYGSKFSIILFQCDLFN